jgi:hypothetical protein
MPDWVTILVSGGIVAALITVGANELSKKRQNEIEIKKHRMDILSQHISLYNRLALYTNWNISWNLREAKKNEKPIDYPLIMYYVCDFLQLRKQLICSLGTLQFDNLDADEIINNIERAIVVIIKQEFSEIEFSKLSSLVNDDTPYHKFHEKINENENKDLFEKFKSFLENNRDNLEQKCRWYSDLIMFELTHIYKIWYKQEPKFSKLSEDLKEELKKDPHHPKYYKRIKKIGKIGESNIF